MTTASYVLLEKAARAAGLPWDQWVIDGDDHWNSLEVGDHAMDLVVALGLSVDTYPIYSLTKHSVIVKQRRRSDQLRESNPTEVIEPFGSDAKAAMCLAITRCAAAVWDAQVSTTHE